VTYMTVLHIIPSSASGGAPINVCRFIAKSGYDHFVVIARDDDLNFNALERSAKGIYNVPIRRLSVRTLGQILRIVRINDIKIIHSHGKGAGLYGRIVARWLGIRSVHTYRGYHNPYMGWKAKVYHRLEQFLSRWTNTGIAVSHSEQDKILEDRIIDSAKLSVLPNPISPAADMPNFTLPECLDNHIICLARISFQKDILTLLEIASRLKGKCHFHVFGGTNSSDKDYELQVKDWVKKNQLNNVHFHGDIPNASALIKYYPIFLSTARWEGLPTAIAEAMLSGVAVVATACTGNVDLIKDRETGLLCPVEDAPAISDAIQELLDDGDLRQELAGKGQILAKDIFDIEVIVKQQEAIYTQVLNGV
jgi:glycosyltransferase involved in cell wall biosynthesis